MGNPLTFDVGGAGVTRTISKRGSVQAVVTETRPDFANSGGTSGTGPCLRRSKTTQKRLSLDCLPENDSRCAESSE